MKILSIKSPWAELIGSGQKTMELRTWKTDYRGSLGIHRSGKNAAIIATVELVDIIPINSPDIFRATAALHLAPPDYYNQRLWGWLLASPEPYDPIYCKGKLKLWEHEI